MPSITRNRGPNDPNFGHRAGVVCTKRLSYWLHPVFPPKKLEHFNFCNIFNFS